MKNVGSGILSENLVASDDQQKHSVTWTQWPKSSPQRINERYGEESHVMSSQSRTNIIVDNFAQTRHTHQIFLASKNSRLSQRIADQPSSSNLNLNYSKSGFSYSLKDRRITSGKSNTVKTMHNRHQSQPMSNNNEKMPTYKAGLELQPLRNSMGENGMRATCYNGVFSAKTFEMVVPEGDQVIRMASQALFPEP